MLWHEVGMAVTEKIDPAIEEGISHGHERRVDQGRIHDEGFKPSVERSPESGEEANTRAFGRTVFDRKGGYP